jgi:hypothetical protein
MRIPPKKVREKFLLVYELEGCQKALNYLTDYYGVRRMRVILNGRKVGRGDEACYFEDKAYLSKKGLNKQTVLHELYHHLVETQGLESTERIEEKEADVYARLFICKNSKSCLHSRVLDQKD